jgi:shikimate dehydrogenase
VLTGGGLTGGGLSGAGLSGGLSGSTRLAAVIGHPIRHSLSPALYNAAFQALGLDWVFLAFDVAPGDGEAAVAAMRPLGIEGLSVTMPHKEAAARAVDERSPVAERLGAVNSVALHPGGRLVGSNTDGSGLVDALRADEGFDPAGKRCLVLGAGGAGRAVVLALADAGAAEVVVWGRTAGRAESAAGLAGERGRAVETPYGVEFDLLVNATPVGMPDSPGLPVDPAEIRKGTVVVDLIYHPPVTPLLEAARERKAVAVNGLGMLIHQAAHQFRLWTAEDPPVEAMSAAALAAIAHRGQDAY